MKFSEYLNPDFIEYSHPPELRDYSIMENIGTVI
jgi:hypothetical protein